MVLCCCASGKMTFQRVTLVVTLVFLTGLSACIGAACGSLPCHPRLPTLSRLLSSQPAVLYAILSVVMISSCGMTMAWSWLAVRTRWFWAVAAAEVAQGCLLVLTLVSYTDARHEGLTIAFVCLVYAKTGLTEAVATFAARIRGWRRWVGLGVQTTLVALSASFLGYFALAQSQPSAAWEYAGVYLLPALHVVPAVLYFAPTRAPAKQPPRRIRHTWTVYTPDFSMLQSVYAS